MRWVLFALALLIPAADPGTVAIRDATVVVAPVLTLPKATVVIRDGLIAEVGPGVAPPQGAEVIDGKGLVVYAGFIDARTTLGLPDTKRAPEALRLAEGVKPEFAKGPLAAMEQANRKGLRPELDAAALVNMTEAEAKKAHAGGFTLAAVAPAEEFLAGRTALVSLSGAPRRNALVRGSTGMHASFRSYGEGYPGTTMGAIAHLRQAFLDARHYARLWEAHRPGGPRPAVDPALEALQPLLRAEAPLIFEADTDNDILRAIALAEEFGLKLVISGGTEAHRVAGVLKEKKIPVILSLKLPKEPPKKKEKDDDEPDKLRKERERLREEAVQCARRLFEAKVPFSFSTAGLASPGDALGNLQKRIEKGLPAEAALAALTTSPAKLFGLSGTHGTVEKGKAANLTVLTAPLGDKKAHVRYVFSDGRKFEFDVKKPSQKPEIEIGGRYTVFVALDGGNIEAALDLKQSGNDLSGTIKAHFGEAPVQGTVSGKTFEFSVTVTLGERKIDLAFKGEKTDAGLKGTVAGPTGEKEWSATPEEQHFFLLAPAGGSAQDKLGDRDVEIEADRKPKTRTGGTVFIKNATILTVAEAGRIEGGSIHVRDGKIAAVGKGLPEPAGIAVIDAAGLFVMPGIIDCHSHLATDGGLNEGTQSVTPEVRVRDVLDPHDVGIYRALAGGVTSANILHGSANAIGGQNATVKFKYGKLAREMLFPQAPRGVKFALGENPKQSNWSNRGKRFPNSRLGVEATFRRAFTEAQEYEKALKADPLARRDLRLEALLGILKGEIIVHCHCYRADEILMILQVSQDFGFRVATLQHVLEGYKVAPEIAAAGVGASTFSDWWAYKVEAFDAIPYNAALMTQAGVTVSINSDSAEQIRHLNLEAAKAVKYGGLSEREALALVTLNPARQLRVDKHTGTIERGKDADLAIYNGHPLSAYSRCVMTLVDGEVYFEDRDVPSRATRDFRMDDRPRRAPGPLPRGETVAIADAMIHPVSSPPFRGTLVVRKGKIAEMGPDVRPPREAEVIEATGLSVYPGLIDASTRLGLTEIGSVAGTRDDSEIGGIQPDLKAITAVNPHSELIPVTRASGITSALTWPDGGLITGQSAVIRLDGWVPKEMALQEVYALHVNFPALRGADDSKAEEEKRLKELRAPFEEARRYTGKDRDLKIEALLPYLKGERPVVFHANRAREIKAAVGFAEEFKLRPIIAGGQEAWKVAAFLAQKRVPVIVFGVMTLPFERHDPYTATYSNPARLSQAGVKFAISAAEHFAGNSRNTPYHAAWAAAYGLDRDEALKAVTLYPAQILGVADRVGSLEPGKSADLIVTTGDPLEVATDLVYSFINGRAVPLESRHTRLYEKFRQRLEQKK